MTSAASRFARCESATVKFAARVPPDFDSVIRRPAEIRSVARARYADSRLVEGCLMDKNHQPKACSVLPVFLIVAFSADSAADDGGELFDAGNVRQQPVFWNGVGWFKELLDPSTDSGAFLASLVAQPAFSATSWRSRCRRIVVALSMPREAGASRPAW